MNNPRESSSVTHVRGGLMKALINHSSTIETVYTENSVKHQCKGYAHNSMCLSRSLYLSFSVSVYLSIE